MRDDIMNELFEELVPSMGKADTVAGELIRATARIRYRFFNDGDKVATEYGNETCNGSLRYINKKLRFLSGAESLNHHFYELWDGESMTDEDYEVQLELCVEELVKFITKNTHLKSVRNEDDSTCDFNIPEDFDYYDEEDDYDDDDYSRVDEEYDYDY